MLKRIVWAALAGWAAIVWLAWHMADRRIELCYYDKRCIIRATETRDAALVWGLSVALVIAVVAAILVLRTAGQRRRGRFEASGRVSLVTRVSTQLASLRAAGSPRFGKLALLGLAVAMFGAGWLGAIIYSSLAARNAPLATLASAPSPYDAFSDLVEPAPDPVEHASEVVIDDPDHSAAAMGEVYDGDTQQEELTDMPSLSPEASDE